MNSTSETQENNTNTPPHRKTRKNRGPDTLKEQRINERVKNWRKLREDLVNERRNISREEETCSDSDENQPKRRSKRRRKAPMRLKLTGKKQYSEERTDINSINVTSYMNQSKEICNITETIKLIQIQLQRLLEEKAKVTSI